MASKAEQAKEDDEAVEAHRAKFGDQAASRLAADLYKLRRTPDNSFGAGFPRGIVILIALWVGLLETADKLPLLLLAIPKYEATLAEYNAKTLQPLLARAQLNKAQFEAKAARWQPALTAAQGYAAQMQWLQGVPNDAWKGSGNLAITKERPD